MGDSKINTNFPSTNPECKTSPVATLFDRDIEQDEIVREEKNWEPVH